MALPIPKLDDRDFQGLVDEAKKRIPAYFDGWTDHNVSDPGVTLIELFAWMTDIILYRQNQIPDRLYLAMMSMLGMTLQPPLAASARVTFQLSAPLDQRNPFFQIDAGTAVATTQTEQHSSTIFSTDEALKIYSAELTSLFILRQDNSRDNVAVDQFNLRDNALRLFTPEPRSNDAVYFGFAAEENLSQHLLQFRFELEEAGGTAGVNPRYPPFVWECASPNDAGDTNWSRCFLESDETSALVHSGRMFVELDNVEPMPIAEQSQTLQWVRLRILDKSEYQLGYEIRPYTQSPKVRQVGVNVIGASVTASHAEVIKDEFLGYSSGAPGQQFTLQATPILEPRPEHGETLYIRDPATNEERVWEKVDSFAPARANEQTEDEVVQTRKIYTLDLATGEIRLPPVQTNEKGRVHQYGAIPPRGATLWFRQYRHGSGIIGNVRPYALNTLKASIPTVGRVYNRLEAKGGQDVESLESAKWRAPQLVFARNRAVTAADFECLAHEAGVSIGRAKCLQPEPGEASMVDAGTVYVYVLPKMKETAVSPKPQDYRLPDADLNKIAAFLNERRLLTTRLKVTQPRLHWVSVHVICHIAPGAAQEQVEEDVKERLYRYLNPLTGGEDKKGWPYGRDLSSHDVYHCLQGISGILAIPEIALYEWDPGRPDSKKYLATGVLSLPPHDVIASGPHEVIFKHKRH